MDPKWTYVPVVGGHGENTTVPLFSRCRPNIELTPEEMMNLTKAVRTAWKNIVKVISFPWFITYFLGFYKRKRGEKETKQKKKEKRQKNMRTKTKRIYRKNEVPFIFNDLSLQMQRLISGLLAPALKFS